MKDRSAAFEFSSVLAAPAEILWSHATSPEGVNRELRPLLRMTFPDGVEDLVAGWQPGRKRFRSWLLLAGFVPVEYDDVVFEEVEAGRRFLERSSLLTQRVWEHERVIEPTEGGCRLTDRVRFEPRAPGLTRVQRATFQAVFRWRHRNLRRLFGASAATRNG